MNLGECLLQKVVYNQAMNTNTNPKFEYEEQYGFIVGRFNENEEKKVVIRRSTRTGYNWAAWYDTIRLATGHEATVELAKQQAEARFVEKPLFR